MQVYADCKKCEFRLRPYPTFILLVEMHKVFECGYRGLVFLMHVVSVQFLCCLILSFGCLCRIILRISKAVNECVYAVRVALEIKKSNTI